MSAARPGEELLVDARVIKEGRSLAFLECEVRKREGGAVVLRGTHTKFVGMHEFDPESALGGERSS